MKCTLAGKPIQPRASYAINVEKIFFEAVHGLINQHHEFTEYAGGQLNCRVVCFPGTNPDGLFDGSNKNLPIAYFSGLC